MGTSWTGFFPKWFKQKYRNLSDCCVTAVHVPCNVAVNWESNSIKSQWKKLKNTVLFSHYILYNVKYKDNESVKCFYLGVCLCGWDRPGSREGGCIILKCNGCACVQNPSRKRLTNCVCMCFCRQLMYLRSQSSFWLAAALCVEMTDAERRTSNFYSSLLYFFCIFLFLKS